MEQYCIDKGLSEFGCSCVTWGLYLGYFLFIIAILSLVVLPLMNALKAPKELIKSAIGVGALLLLFLIAYAFSGDEVTMKAATHGITPGSSKFIGAGLIMFYIVFVVAIIGLFYSFIAKAFK